MKKNPFLPSFGRVPSMVLDQKQTLSDYLTGLVNHDGKYQTSLVYGVRGSGKTVFLINVEHQLVRVPNWAFLRLTLSQGNLLLQLINGLQQIRGIDWTDVLKAFSAEINFSVFGITLKSSSSTQTINYKSVLERMLTQLKQRGISVLIGIDEIEISDDVRAFGSMYQMLIGEEFDIALIMTGLPSRISDLQNDNVLTFLLRSNRIYLAKLDQQSIMNSYQKAFQNGSKTIDAIAVNTLANAAGGYPYAFQTVGYYAWRLSEDDVIDEQVVAQTIKKSKVDLYRNAYEKLYTETSANDRQVLNAIAAYSQDDVPISFVQEKLAKPKNYISVYRARLKDAQLIESSGWGKVRFSLPFFGDFIHWYHNSHLV